ncbi:MAG: cytochrome b/b6 domain-containing protein [Methylotetracoccus sp.]
MWDLPTRVVHWSLAAGFTGAYLTGDTERWRDLHVLLGYLILGLIAFRIVWGFCGSRHARFHSFVRGPRVVAGYLIALLRGHPPDSPGHNPLGALSVLTLLALGLATSLTGWLIFRYDELGDGWLVDAHAIGSDLMLALVVLHLLGVLHASIVHRENLPLAMLTGFKRGSRAEHIDSTHPLIAALVATALIAALLSCRGSGLVASEAPETSVTGEATPVVGTGEPDGAPDRPRTAGRDTRQTYRDRQE